MIELTVPDAEEEGGDLSTGEKQARAVRILGVAHGDAEVSQFDATAACIARDSLAPGHLRQADSDVAQHSWLPLSTGESADENNPELTKAGSLPIDTLAHRAPAQHVPARSTVSCR